MDLARFQGRHLRRVLLDVDLMHLVEIGQPVLEVVAVAHEDRAAAGRVFLEDERAAADRLVADLVDVLLGDDA